MLKEMFKKTTYISIERGKYEKESEQENITSSNEPNVPVGMWMKCPNCTEAVYADDVKENNHICPKCGYNLRISWNTRIDMVADNDTFEEWDKEMEISNPLDFEGYENKLEGARKKLNINEAVVTGKCKIGGFETAIGICDASFMMASMGHVVGEKITRMVERATSKKLPVIIFACSGGARMQEGIISLMQMAKTSAALKKHSEAGNLYISVLTDPTTGGVTASFAMLGDIIIAEPNALIGFAGPRVIKQTIGQKLPDGFQRAEYLLEKGFVDAIVDRNDMKDTLAEILRLHCSKEDKINTYEHYLQKNEIINSIPLKSQDNMKCWDKVQIARSHERLTALDYINRIFKDFIEFHGDRNYRDDGAVVGGIASIGGMPVTVIAEQKGKNTKENIVRNFGMPYPEGYRKALRLMKQAEKFNRPIICFVDTPGAFCGIEAEERGQGQAIANNLFEMSDIKVPIVSIVIGEGGSGGALALAVANEVWMLENSTYSILSPEGFASILYKDAKLAPKAAEAMKMTAKDLFSLKVIEKIIPEPQEATEKNVKEISGYIKNYIKEFIAKYKGKNSSEIITERYERFRSF